MVLGISSVFADHKSERVIVKTSLNSGKVQQLIESTGRQAVLQGLGSGKGESTCDYNNCILVHFLLYVEPLNKHELVNLVGDT